MTANQQIGTDSTPTNELPLPPGVGALHALTETLAFLRDPKSFNEQRIARYGKIFRTHMLGRPTVVVTDAAAIRDVLAREHKQFEASWPASARALLGDDSIATQLGDRHLHRRRLLNRPFRPSVLQTWLPTIIDIADRRIDDWLAQEQLVLGPQLQAFAFEVAAKLFLDATDGELDALLAEFGHYVDGLFSVPVALPWTKFGRAMRARSSLQQRLGRLIDARRSSGALGDDALGQLLAAEDEEGARLSDVELRDQVLVLMFAGHETTGTGLTSLAMLLAQHPNAATAIADELDERPVASWERKWLAERPSLSRTVQETLRLIPPVGGAFRVATEQTTVGGFRVPSGWAVLYGIAGAHSDPEQFETPAQFCPHRFTAGQSPPVGYMPFGGGARICLGMNLALLEMQVLAGRLVQRAHLSLVEGQDLRFRHMPTPRPRSGLVVRLASKGGRAGASREPSSELTS